MSVVILESFTGVTIVTVSVLVLPPVVAAAVTVTRVCPSIVSAGLSTSATYIFCFPGERNITPLLNFFCHPSSVVKDIAFPGLGTVSPKVSEIKIIEPL